MNRCRANTLGRERTGTGRRARQRRHGEIGVPHGEISVRRCFPALFEAPVQAPQKRSPAELREQAGPQYPLCRRPLRTGGASRGREKARQFCPGAAPRECTFLGLGEIGGEIENLCAF